MYPGMRRQGGGGNNLSTSRVDQSVDGILASLHCYLPQDRVRISQDVSNLLFAFGTLKPTRDNIILNDGSSHEWLKITGVVPISFMNNTYNIPIDLWVPEGYPRRPAQLFVTPTQDMLIQPDHNNVQRDGLVHLPYLNSWHPHRSNLAELVTHAAEVFSSAPPVFAKPKDPVQSVVPPPYQPPPPAYSRVSNGGMDLGKPPPAYSLPRRGGGYQHETEEVRKRKLVDALEVKLQYKFKAFAEAIRSDMENEFETSEQLAAHKQEIEDRLAALEKHHQELDVYNATLSKRKMELYEWIQANKQQENNSQNLSADDLVEPADLWSQQLLQCVAESSAVDDTLYHLDKALAREVIDLKSFLKEVRKLARKQFMRKALALKIMDKQQSTR